MKRRTYRLVDESTGEWMRAKSIPLGTFIEVDDMLNVDVMRLLVSNVEDWNLTHPDNSEALSVCWENFLLLDPADAKLWTQRWLTAVSSVTGPLAESSNGGGRSLEESIPMEVLSSSPPS